MYEFAQYKDYRSNKVRQSDVIRFILIIAVSQGAVIHRFIGEFEIVAKDVFPQTRIIKFAENTRF